MNNVIMSTINKLKLNKGLHSPNNQHLPESKMIQSTWQYIDEVNDLSYKYQLFVQRISKKIAKLL